MFYRIVELATEEPRGRTYALVHYWRFRTHFERGRLPARIEDFIIDAPPRREERIVTDSRGWLLTRGGTAIDPRDFDSILGIENWRRETVTVDRRAFIHRIVEAYWWRAEAEGYARDQSSSHIEKSNRDPDGVLAEARSMVGEGRLVRTR